MTKIMSDEYDLGDINKIKESLGFITKLESARLTDRIEENKLERLKLEKNMIKIPKLNMMPEYIN